MKYLLLSLTILFTPFALADHAVIPEEDHPPVLVVEDAIDWVNWTSAVIMASRWDNTSLKGKEYIRQTINDTWGWADESISSAIRDAHEWIGSGHLAGPIEDYEYSINDLKSLDKQLSAESADEIAQVWPKAEGNKIAEKMIKKRIKHLGFSSKETRLILLPYQFYASALEADE